MFHHVSTCPWLNPIGLLLTVSNEFPLIFALGVDWFALLYALASGGLENYGTTLLHVPHQTNELLVQSHAIHSLLVGITHAPIDLKSFKSFNIFQMFCWRTHS